MKFWIPIIGIFVLRKSDYVDIKSEHAELYAYYQVLSIVVAITMIAILILVNLDYVWGW